VSSITTDHGVLHFEVLGRGRPVILLHGWLGSWGLWQETMTFLGQSYRTYALDFWGFGESGRKASTYCVQDYVSMVEQFMDQMGIVRAPLIGHSMGGTVSLALAIQSAQRVEKVAVIGSPVDGESLALPLKLAGRRIAARLLFTFFPAFRAAMRAAAPRISRDPRFPEMMDRDLSRTTADSFLTSISTLRRTDLRGHLRQIQVPVMGMYGDRDNIVDPGQGAVLQAGIPQARIERFPQAGHFIMLDETKICMEKLKSFLDELPGNEA